MSSRDAKGHYARLGVAPDADPAEIRRAYREQVKRLHPDRNPGADPADFRALADAYGVLRDPERRARYDRLSETVDAAERERRRAAESSRGRETPHRETPKPGGRADGPREKPRSTRPQPAAPPASGVFAAVLCDRCGRIPAQPRYLVFEQVIGTLARSRRREFAGVFCRRCADITALRATAVTWLLGWWSLVPFGPWRALRAIFANLAGGVRPADRNAALLAQQARAFYGMGRFDIAGSLAIQAYTLAPDQEIRRIIEATGAQRERRRLKDRWRLGGWGFVVQALPIGLLVAVLVVEGTALGTMAIRNAAERISGGGAERSAPPPVTLSDRAAPAGSDPDRRFVMPPRAVVREGPGEDLGVVARLRQGDTVDVVGLPTRDGWLPVRTVDGLWGYVGGDVLTPGRTARLAWCREGVGVRPTTGSVLTRNAAGGHTLEVVNREAVDSVVKLRDSGDRTVLAFFVRANSKVEIDRVPDGSFAVQYATGSDYSRTCGLFVEEMRSWRFPRRVTFGDPAARDIPFTRQVAINDTGPAGTPEPLPDDRFTID